MNKTLRQWAGLVPPSRIDPASSALLLIDFQREYFDGKVPLPMASSALAAARDLVQVADATGVTVVHVHHVAGSHAAALFTPDSTGVEPVAELTPAVGHGRVVKSLPSSFVATGLLDLLRQRDCKTVIVCGLMTHNCVDATARDALSLGFSVVIAADACGTRDLPDASDGTVIPARQLHAAVLAGLADRTADVFNTAQLVALLRASKEAHT